MIKNKKKQFGNIIIKIYEKCPDNWNDFLKLSEFGTYYQTKEYSDYRKKIVGHIPVFLQFFIKQELIGELLLFQTKFALNYSKKIFGDGKIFSAYKKIAKTKNDFTWNYGPVVKNSAYNKEIMNALWKFLDSNKSTFRGYANPLSKCVFEDLNGINVKKSGTFVIDLGLDIDKILLNTDKNSVRKNIKRSEKREVIIKEIKNDNEINYHYKLLKEHRLRNNLISPSKESVKKMYEFGKNKGITGFIAFYNKKPIGSITLAHFNGYLVEQGITRSKIDIEEKLYSQELLRMEIIKWGKNNYGKYYDLAGISIGDRNSKEEGIFRNKKKWGGKLITYITYFR